MKKILSTVAATGIIFAAANAGAVTIQGTATATVVPNINVSQTAQLSFGTFAPGTGGTVVVGAAGTSTTGDVQKISNGVRGAFDVTGAANTAYNITVDNNVTLNSGANSMTATLTAPAAGTLDGSGDDSFNVDGTLTVGNNQASGTYNGTYNVTVNY